MRDREGIWFEPPVDPSVSIREKRGIQAAPSEFRLRQKRRIQESGLGYPMASGRRIAGQKPEETVLFLFF
jgi:hypothetical protein